ncbi:MAG: hypothetical protein EBU84_00455 [Actinobacteria bacterium]|nr:hypothetical protein [Actinomycetota bacterium]
MKKFKFDIFAAIESTGVELAGFRHIERRGGWLVVRSQIQDVTSDVFVWEITPEGGVTLVGREAAFSD